ncbi:D-alanyl-D-alanine carboxypeptidase [uncultured Alphaproteobacteria bacterium]|uniref:D-alanyl-D-alanine carboxypeptidase n=1 Tax=uncultured Alphaproteobacteria bacterium TaxID=91750 RepID=A0A212KMK0_9PROT|nr:D-alanyl-D-alanine carboxypeptidase [uncultured Alphaproteobacteria bacterium]
MNRLALLVRANSVPAARRRARSLSLALLGLMLLVSPSSAFARYAAFVMDADTGRTLYADRAEEQNHPASLTKMMTLYLLFEDMQLGRVNLGTKFKVTARAERQPPSALGLRKGETITVQDAIRALVIKSANDVAVTVAENLAPNEQTFAVRMTRKAQLLGMSRTVFKNASGLHNKAQVTTAHDLARLALALRRDFPKQYAYFSLREFDWEGRTIPTHNNLVKSYPGADGLKTGFIQASGFNLAASATRDGRRLIAVVMGGDTAAWRDRRTADLLDRGFEDITYAKAKTPTPPLNPKNQTAVAALAKYSGTDGSDAVGEGDAETGLDLVAETTAPLMQPIPDLAPDAAAADVPAAAPRKPKAPETAVAALSPAPASRKPGGSWAIQVGAYSDRRAAETAANQAMLAQGDAGGANPRIEAYKGGQRTLYRARVVGLSAADAQRACVQLKREARPCMVLRP